MTEAINGDLPWFLRPGMRKVTVLAPCLAIALLGGTIALFTGHLPPETFKGFVIGVLSWGGGIFAGANVLEHLAKSIASKKA